MAYSDKIKKVVSPSQWTNLIWIILGVILIQTVIFPILALVKILEIYCWRYEFRQKTIIERKGILSVTRREVHFYRIKSIKIDEPLWMRIFGLANVTIKTSDPYLPELLLYAVPKGIKIREKIRSKTHEERRSEGIKEFDMYNL